jgi:hypothetical protein
MPEVNEQCPSATYELWSFAMDNNAEQTKMSRSKFPGHQKVQFTFAELSNLSTSLVEIGFFGLGTMMSALGH